MLQIENLEKSYKDKTIIKNISYTFESHHVYGIIGRNGAGKSVLMKLLLGAATPSAGSVSYGESNSEKPVISCVIDGCDLYPNLTGFENLNYLAGFRKKISSEQIKDCIRTVGLDPDSKIKVRKYSLGMKKRLLIAQAIMEDPDILILDEPTNSLDAEGVQLFHRIIKELRNMGKLIIIASHYKEDIEDLCDTILEMRDGILC